MPRARANGIEFAYDITGGMGHDFPVAACDALTEGILRAVERAKAEAA